MTKPIKFLGQEFEVNYSTSAAGHIRVEIQDPTGTPIPGYTLDDCPAVVGDKIRHVVAWESGADVSSLTGKPVCLRFAMCDAGLYSFRFVDSWRVAINPASTIIQ